MSDDKYWLGFWGIIVVGLLCFTGQVISCVKTQDRYIVDAVSHGVDPKAAICAVRNCR